MFIKIYDEMTQNDNYIINTDNVCCVKHYIQTTGLKKTDNTKGQYANYFIEIYFINGNQLTLQFKDDMSFTDNVEKFKKLCKKDQENERPRTNNQE